MIGGLVTLGSAIVSGISGYFQDKMKLKKYKLKQTSYL